MSDTTDVFCPVCKLKNDVSARVCIHCQAILPFQEVNLRTTRRTGGETKLFDTAELIKNTPIPEDGMVIISQESGQEIAVVKEPRFILGRAAAGIQEPVVDLSAFGAYGLGVSRLHVQVQKTETGYEISDLDSTNGTWLNENEVLPNRLYALKNGDTIRMGKMSMMVLFIAKKDSEKTLP
jgi:pSer/pThr/pTyr-binding forkhead associated (FHA) protein